MTRKSRFCLLKGAIYFARRLGLTPQIQTIVQLDGWFIQWHHYYIHTGRAYDYWSLRSSPVVYYVCTVTRLHILTRTQVTKPWISNSHTPFWMHLKCLLFILKWKYSWIPNVDAHLFFMPSLLFLELFP